MGFEVTVQGLSHKRDGLLRELEAAQARVSDLVRQQHHINVTLEALGYDAGGKSTIREKFRGQNSTLVMDVLRQVHGGLVSPEIVRRVLILRGLRPDDDRLVRLMRIRVNATLTYNKKLGVVVSEQGAGTLMHWRVA